MKKKPNIFWLDFLHNTNVTFINLLFVAWAFGAGIVYSEQGGFNSVDSKMMVVVLVYFIMFHWLRNWLTLRRER